MKDMLVIVINKLIKGKTMEIFIYMNMLKEYF